MNANTIKLLVILFSIFALSGCAALTALTEPAKKPVEKVKSAKETLSDSIFSLYMSGCTPAAMVRTEIKHKDSARIETRIMCQGETERLHVE